MKCIAVVLAFLATADALPAETPQAAHPISKERASATPFLWRIAGTKPSYLFGTIHAARPEVTSLPGSVRAAFKSSDAVYTEISMDPASLVELSGKLFMRDGQTLSKLLPSDLVEEIRAEIRSISPQIELAPLDRLKVWAFAMALTQLEEQLESGGAAPLDLILFQKAASAGKETAGIETLDEQLGIFEKFSTDDQVRMLRETVRMMREMRSAGERYVDQLIRLYVSGDLDALALKINEWMALGDKSLNDRFKKLLLDDRNIRMADRIATKLREQPGKTHFFAIGAAHLYGSAGLVALLENNGFKLDRIKSGEASAAGQ